MITIGVIGGRKVNDKLLNIAYEAGRLIALNKAVLISGGLTGVMEAVSKGAKEAGGITVGVLPHDNKTSANQYIDIPICTGIGFARNVIIVNTAQVLIAIGGEYSTLSEIAFALQLDKTVIGIETWDIPGIIKAQDALSAVNMAFEIANNK
ncbi:hypothetical protein MCHI_003834 [Candidatus Magnetoovum chiemensis]|nr:hypothetical protein MCHI_003834 [Candidatus Magnetoovum chiemensis]